DRSRGHERRREPAPRAGTVRRARRHVGRADRRAAGVDAGARRRSAGAHRSRARDRAPPARAGRDGRGSGVGEETMNKIAVSLARVAVAGGGWYWFYGRPSNGASPDLRFRTAKAERSEVVEGVQASGTVQPVLLVQVGTQVSGVIEKLFADFNSKVKAN